MHARNNIPALLAIAIAATLAPACVDPCEANDDAPDCLRRCRVIALGLTGNETADDIRGIVERFNASRVPE